MSEKEYINRINPWVGVMSTFGAMRDSIIGGSIDRSEAINDDIGTHVIDTVVAFDTGDWETGIQIKPSEGWVIVQQYRDEDGAKAGHAEWIRKLKENPKLELKDINVWGVC